MAQVNLSYTVLSAPISGVVLVRQAELGEVVAPGTPVVTIADVDRLWMRGYINETDLGQCGGINGYRAHGYSPGRITTVAYRSSRPERIHAEERGTYKNVTLVYRQD